MNKGIHRSVSAAGFVRRQRGVSVSLIPRTERSILGSSSHKLKWRNSIDTPRSSLYTPLKITIDENTNLPLNLLNTTHLRLFLPHFFLSSAHPFLHPKCVRIVRIGENGVEK